MMKTLRLYLGLTLLLLLAGCSAQDFPGCCDPTGDRDVSFSETFLFNFKTGVGDISKGNPAGNLQIVSHADLATLLSAAQDQQLLDQNLGMVSGQVLFNGAAVQDVALKVTDANGDILAIRIEGEKQTGGQLLLPDGTFCPAAFISDTLCVSKTPQGSIYYNSPGGIPDFSNNKGTSEAGSFTIFNVPVGDVYLWASRAARGNMRITIFSDRISVGDIQVFPIPIATTDVDGNTVDVSKTVSSRVSNATITILGSNPTLATSSGEEGNYIFPSIGANSHFIMESRKTDFWTTYQNLNTAPFQGEANIPTVNLDAKLYPNTYIDDIATTAGVPLPGLKTKGIIAGRVQKGDGTPQHCAQLTVTDRTGKNLLNDGVRIAYPGNDRPDCTRKDPNDPDKIISDPNQTSSSGQFIILNLPPGEVFIRFVAKLQSGSAVNLLSGGAIASAFPGVVFDLDLFNSGNGASQELSGRVSDEGNVFSPDVDIDILGITPGIYNSTFNLALVKSDTATGDYLIPENVAAEDPPYPLVAGTPYRLKTSKAGAADTYQAVRMVNSATSQDLVISNASPPSPGQGEIHGMLLNQGTGRLAKNVRLKITDLSGAFLGGGEVFSVDGQFTISGLAPGLVNLQVISGDDSGNMVVRVYDQGVSFVKFPMVKVIPAEINAKGTVKDLAGNDVVSSLKVLGRSGTVSSTQLEAGTLKLDTNSRFVIKAPNAGFDTYNFFPKTGIVDAVGLNLFSISRSEMTTIAGGTPDPLNGIIVGKTVENRFDLVSSATTCDSTTAHGLAAGFFDQDTNLDIAITNCSGPSPSDRVSILFGDGSGGFSTPSAQDMVSVGKNPVAVALGDFDGDGSSDLAVANQGDDPTIDAGISILLGDQNGQFTLVSNPLLDENKNVLPTLEIVEDLTVTPPVIGVPGVPSPVNSPVALAVGLFDPGTDLDIAVVNSGDNSVFVLLGNGDGTFRPNVDQNNGNLISNLVGGTPTAILARNFNKDTLDQLDLAIATTNTTTMVDSLLVLHGNIADGTFQQPNSDGTLITNPITVADPRAMVTVDLNSDGDLDLAVVSGNSEIAIFTGNASGTFDQLKDVDDIVVPNISVGFGISNITFGEFNGDNRVDLAVSDKGNATENDQVYVLFGIGDGTFSAPIPLLATTPAPGIIPDQILSANLDNNNLIDLIVVGSKIGSLLGSEKAVGGISVEARDMAGLPAGGNTRYLDCAGLVSTTLQATISCASPDEDKSGRFVILNLDAPPVPPGLPAPPALTVVRAKNAKDFPTGTCPVQCAAGNSIINTFADSVSFATVRTTALNPIEVTVNGVTFDPVGPPPAGRPVGTVQIDVLGTDPPPQPIESTSGLGTEGDYQLTLDANSEYILKLSFQGP